MTDDDWEFSSPDITQIQCKDCKHIHFMEWEGRIIRMPDSWICKKYTRDNQKPDGILYRKYDISKHERECDGHYIPCKYYEKE